MIRSLNPSRYGLRFHHLGLAAREEGPAMVMLAGLGYRIGDLVADPQQNVRVAMCHGDDLPTIELVLPLDGLGPLAAVLKRHDAGFYHSCFATDDADAAIRAMNADRLGLLQVSPPKPAVLFGGTPVSFYYIAGFGLVELIHGSGGF